MISFHPENPYPNIPEGAKEALQSFARASEVFFGIGKTASEEEMIQAKIQLSAISEGVLAQTNPMIQMLASKLLHKIENMDISEAKTLSLSSFLTNELLLEGFVLSEGAKEQIVALTEGPAPFIPLMRECEKFLKSKAHYLGETYISVNPITDQWVKAVQAAKNTITLSNNTFKIETTNVFSIEPDPSKEGTGPVKRLYIAAKICIEIPKEEFENPSWDPQTSNVESRYEISDFCEDIAIAENFFSAVGDKKFLPEYMAPTDPKEDVLSILQSVSRNKASVMKQFRKDFKRLDDITFHKEGEWSENISSGMPDISDEEVISKFQERLGGEAVLSQIAALLSQTVWGNLTTGLKEYPMHNIDPNQYNFETFEETLEKEFDEAEVLTALSLEEPLDIPNQNGILEKSCLFKVKDVITSKEEFIAAKLYINTKDKEVLPLLSKLYSSKEEAKEALPFLQADFTVKGPSTAPAKKSLTKGRGPLEHGRVAPDIASRIQKLDRSYKKDAEKGNNLPK